MKQPLQAESGSSYIVDVVIQKSDIKGISKYEVHLPEGFAIRAIETSGSIFKSEKNIGKFIWVDLPSSEEILLSYQVYIPKDASYRYSLNNTFYYLDQSSKIASSFNSVIEIKKNSKKFTLKDLDELIRNNPDGDVYFSIQLAALTKPLSNQSLKNYFQTQENIKVIREDGLYKYTVGEFKNYSDALDFKNQLKIEDAFLVVYFIDYRISVEQAFKILGK